MVDATTGANGTTHSIKETGTNNTTTVRAPGFGLLTTLSPTTGGVTNISGIFRGMTFWVKASGQAATLRVEVVSSTDQSSGNTDFYGNTFTVGTAWQHETIPSSSFTTIGFGTAGTLASELANAVQFQWQTENSAYTNMTFWGG